MDFGNVTTYAVEYEMIIIIIFTMRVNMNLQRYF